MWGWQGQQEPRLVRERKGQVVRYRNQSCGRLNLSADRWSQLSSRTRSCKTARPRAADHGRKMSAQARTGPPLRKLARQRPPAHQGTSQETNSLSAEHTQDRRSTLQITVCQLRFRQSTSSRSHPLVACTVRGPQPSEHVGNCHAHTLQSSRRRRSCWQQCHQCFSSSLLDTNKGLVRVPALGLLCLELALLPLALQPERAPHRKPADSRQDILHACARINPDQPQRRSVFLTRQ